MRQSAWRVCGIDRRMVLPRRSKFGASAAAIAALFALLAHGTAARAQEAPRNITLLIGFAAGGGYDTFGRLIARHWGRHLPGNPTVVPQNMPGGGSLVVANLIYNVAPRDGSQVGLFASSAALEPVIGNPQAKFDTASFTWIGNMNKDVSACAAWAASGIRSWDDAVKRGARFGGVGLSAPTTQHAAFFKNVLGAPIKIIVGYGGTNDVNLAMQRGEVDASCGMFVSSVKGPYARDVETGNLKMIIQLGRDNHPAFGDAVNIYTLLRTTQEEELADFVFGQVEIARPIAAPPQTPEPIATALRRSFDATMRDPDFLADARRVQLDIAPMTGEETSRAFTRFTAVSKEVAARAKAAMTPNP